MDEFSSIDPVPLAPLAWPAASHDDCCMTDLDHSFLSEVKALLTFPPQSSIVAPDVLHLNPHQVGDTGTPDGGDSYYSSSMPISPMSATPDSVAKKPIRKRRGHKNELNALRTKLEELQEHLEFLKRRETKINAGVLGRALVGSILPPAMRMILLCSNDNDAQTVAIVKNGVATTGLDAPDRRAREEMKQLVLENIRLRSLVDTQLAISRDLGSVFYKPVRASSV